MHNVWGKKRTVSISIAASTHDLDCNLHPLLLIQLRVRPPAAEVHAAAEIRGTIPFRRLPRLAAGNLFRNGSVAVLELDFDEAIEVGGTASKPQLAAAVCDATPGQKRILMFAQGGAAETGLSKEKIRLVAAAPCCCNK